MKIIDIQLNPKSAILQTETRALSSLILTTKSLFGGIKKINAYPTHHSIIINRKVTYYLFVNDLGVAYSNKISKQLSDFCITQQLLGKIS